MKIVEAAMQGQVALVVCGRLMDEVSDVLEREKFRRWITVDDARDFVAAIELLADWVDDRPEAEIPKVCTDPDDDYLVALCQDADTSVLVSGDRAVRNIRYPNIQTYTAAEALDLLDYRHKWGEGFLPADPSGSRLAIEAEGSTALITVYSAFTAIFEHAANQAEAEQLLGFVTVPSAVPEFLAAFDQVREMLADRGVGSRPIFASPDVAYLKLPPNPGETLIAQGELQLPDDTIYATLQRCPDLPNPPELDVDHWRVFGVGGPWPIERIPPRPEPEAGK